jgi:peroxiredoxin
MSTTTEHADWRAHLRESRAGTLLVLLVTAVLVAGAAFLLHRPAPGAAAPISVQEAGGPLAGSPAIGFTAVTVDGKAFTLDSLRGHGVWLTFGASWCASCVAEAPDIEAAYQRAKPRGVEVVEVFMNEEAPTVRDYQRRVGLTVTGIADPDSRITEAYRVLGIPVHYFIDSTGTIRTVRTGSMSPQEMDQELRELT